MDFINHEKTTGDTRTLSDEREQLFEKLQDFKKLLSLIWFHKGLAPEQTAYLYALNEHSNSITMLLSKLSDTIPWS